MLIAGFTFAIANANVLFTDTSVADSVITYLWDFGNGFSSILQNPSHHYTSNGLYAVTLTITNEALETHSFTDNILISVMAPSNTIDSLLAFELSTALFAGLTPEYKASQIQYWQLYLQKAIDPHIADVDVFDETQWPYLVNTLIAKLIVYAYYLKMAKEGIASQIGGSSSETTGGGGTKSIETGPAKVEWYDTSSTVSSIFKSGANGLSVFDSLAQEVCQLASRLRIVLPMCKMIQAPVAQLIKVRKPRC